MLSKRTSVERLVVLLVREQVVRHARINRIERLRRHVESAIAVMFLTILSVSRMVVFPSKKMIVDPAYLRIIVRVTKLVRLAFLVITWTSIRVDRGNVTVHLKVKVVRRVLSKIEGLTMKPATPAILVTI